MGGCKCSYKNCKNNSKIQTLHFFHFPVKHVERCQKWIENTGKTEFKKLEPDQLRNKVVCEAHFEDKCFPNFLKKRLLQFAVPTIDGDNCYDYVYEAPVESKRSKAANSATDEFQILPASKDGSIFILNTHTPNLKSDVETYIYSNDAVVPLSEENAEEGDEENVENVEWMREENEIVEEAPPVVTPKFFPKILRVQGPPESRKSPRVENPRYIVTQIEKKTPIQTVKQPVTPDTKRNVFKNKFKIVKSEIVSPSTPVRNIKMEPQEAEIPLETTNISEIENNLINVTQNEIEFENIDTERLHQIEEIQMPMPPPDITIQQPEEQPQIMEQEEAYPEEKINIKSIESMICHTVEEKYLKKFKKHTKDMENLKRLLHKKKKPNLAQAQAKFTKVNVLKHLKLWLPPTLYTMVSINMLDNVCLPTDDFAFFKDIHTISPEVYGLLTTKYNWNVPDINQLNSLT